MRDGVDRFTKKYSLPKEQVLKLFNKYKFLEENFTNDNQIRVPKVYRTEDSAIIFEKITFDYHKSLQEILCDKNEDLTKKNLSEAGVKLSYIHKKISPLGFVHGDFWAPNIFVSKENSWLIIDWEPPLAVMANDVDFYIKNKKELDIATFLLHSVWGNFSLKQWYRYISPKNKWHKIFLSGYTKKGMYDKKLLRQCIKYEKKRIWRLLCQEKNFLKRSIKKIAYLYIILVHTELRKGL